MNLSAETIIEISLELTQQLIEAHSNNQCFDGIKNIEDKWTIITKEETPADDEPVKLLRSILQHHNPLIPSGLSHGVLQNHLSLMAPDLLAHFASADYLNRPLIETIEFIPNQYFCRAATSGIVNPGCTSCHDSLGLESNVIRNGLTV